MIVIEQHKNKLEKKKKTLIPLLNFNNIIIDFVDHELFLKKNINIQKEFIIEKKKIFILFMWKLTLGYGIKQNMGMQWVIWTNFVIFLTKK
jgi:hypothetical protein